jgi:hypothetical protein
MNTYEFMVTVAGSDFKAYTQSNNPSYAYQKCRRLYPTASEIQFLRLVKNEYIHRQRRFLPDTQ